MLDKVMCVLKHPHILFFIQIFSGFGQSAKPGDRSKCTCYLLQMTAERFVWETGGSHCSHHVVYLGSASTPVAERHIIPQLCFHLSDGCAKILICLKKRTQVHQLLHSGQLDSCNVRPGKDGGSRPLSHACNNFCHHHHL